MGYIYIRTDISKDIDNVCKLGQTNNIPNRDHQYCTGEYTRGIFILVIEILDEKYNHVFVEQLLQIKFEKYHMKKDGGNEFYKIEIINEIEPYLISKNIKYKVLTQEEIDNLTINNKKNVETISREDKFRNIIQEEYIIELKEELIKNKKVFLKAPTGFGKTHIYYKIIKNMGFNKILFLTPRKNLNIQLLDKKYSSYIKDDNFKIVHYSELNISDKEKAIRSCSQLNNTNLIVTSCYQSGPKLLELLKQYNLKFDIIIDDEAHFITTWKEKECIKDFLYNSNITNYRLFASATPTDDIELNSNIYGNIIEKIKVYELINNEILCDIVTIVKKLENKKKEYHNLKDLIVESMIKYNKRKGIIYVNNCENAEKLHKLMKTQDIIKSYIYVSKNDINVDSEDEINISKFEDNSNQCVIIAVAKISYGYDNDFIDFICLGDSRQSDTDIRQIIGRGIRWNKKTYSNKVLHLLIPLYKDEFDKYPKNESLKNYLDYIIGECDKDIIFKADGTPFIHNKKGEIVDSPEYNGFTVPTDILNEYCTTGYNKFSLFQRFLIKNKIHNESLYNNLREKQTWMIDIGILQQKYPKFCFRNIYSNNKIYYWNKLEALNAYENCKLKLIDNIGKEKYSKLNTLQKTIKICEIDDKIPPVNLDLYYPLKN